MFIQRLPRFAFLIAILAAPIAAAAAQRGEKPSIRPQTPGASKPAPTPTPRPAVSPTPRPQAPAVAPRPRTDVPRAIQPPRSAPQPRPTAQPQPTPRPTPRPMQPAPSRPIRSLPQPGAPRSTPRPTPQPSADQPPRTPGRSGNQPGAVRAVGGDVRIPGRTTRPQQPVTPSTPGNPQRPVGGRVRVVDRGSSSAPPRDDTPLRPRDLYDDTLNRPKTTPRPALPRPGDSRPVTTRTIADRYAGKPQPGRPAAGAVPGDTVRSGAAVRPASTLRPRGKGESRPSIADRYVDRGRKVTPGSHVPTLAPRPVAGTVRSRTPTSVVPRLVDRPRTTTSVLSRSLARSGSCFGPVWDPSWSGSNWSTHCSPGLTWTLGIGSGSFCWGWSSWLPRHCHRRTHFSTWYRSWWWEPWLNPCSSPVWCWPNSPYYATATPTLLYPYTVTAAPASSVVVVDEGWTGGDETIEVGGRRSLPPAEEARRYLDLGDFYFREGRFGEAADAYGKARTLLPEDAALHFVLADAVFALGDYHFAAFLIEQALRLDPGLAGADTDKRLLYGDPAVFETQIATLVKYLDEKPYDAMAHLVLGYNLRFSAKPKDAEKALRRVLEIDPESHAAATLLAALAPAAAADPVPAATDR